ncbi:hypothetical protein Zmor_005851 [Zophobas morio]|uniref:Uncharacterized protein n=1 Tax=Zophobas morio TaxID=2755281 RepID=A0AA38ITT0_9CUCU|nr:hypothetical protein Zmor_005851 [Zophobas morio]
MDALYAMQDSCIPTNHLDRPEIVDLDWNSEDLQGWCFQFQVSMDTEQEYPVVLLDKYLVFFLAVGDLLVMEQLVDLH